VVEQIIQDGERKPGNVKRFPVTYENYRLHKKPAQLKTPPGKPYTVRAEMKAGRGRQFVNYPSPGYLFIYLFVQFAGFLCVALHCWFCLFY